MIIGCLVFTISLLGQEHEASLEPLLHPEPADSLRSELSVVDTITVTPEDSIAADTVRVYSTDWLWLPMGSVSFADSIVLFDPGAPGADTGGEPDQKYQDASRILHAPDHLTGDKNFAALGNGGTLILKFVDNVFYNGPGPDLYFWMPDSISENAHVWISRDNIIYKSAGIVSSENPYIDLSGTAEPGVFYTLVKIRDDPFQNTANLPSLGADIDAVAAINTAVIQSVPTDSLFTATQMNLKTDAETTLHSIADVIRQYPNCQVLIEVTTDNAGSGDYNLLLSQQWAKIIRDYFILNEKLTDNRYSASGLGKSQQYGGYRGNQSASGMVQIIILPR